MFIIALLFTIIENFVMQSIYLDEHHITKFLKNQENLRALVV
ncbi:hypothetical protein BRO54_2249 [Geobacillus proteiniphilus]|uniref:Uncharacterized protein n=1 Tax=Geobacillus proteiniphilus TaxID=860353 RepID=A0A1Q5SXT9_9BACL|nr:hypothetical protein BRO54_2249 [Geobacillus proteiniphilus]